MPSASDALAFLACQAAAFAPAAVAFATRTSGPASARAGAASGWYERLRPSWTPPAALFPVVWTLLYACLGAALFLALCYGLGRATLALFAVNLALNAAWSPLFFGRRAFGAALAAVAGMVLTAAGVLAAFAVWARGAVRAAGVALVAPYVAWLCFAGALNAAVLARARALGA